ncbi:MAG: AAA family ATPase [Deltaproteobacteria bacterium]|nr:AAA family ATPase [Deltaproteobacteria bacterium]
MGQEPQMVFGPFRFDPANEQLWQGEQEIALRPKPLAVLHYLVEHPRRLVTKEELIKSVWAGTYVTNTVFKVCIREIRQALGEDSAAPRYVETVSRLGYRFIRETGGKQREQRIIPAMDLASSRSGQVVGREGELRQLQRWLEKAMRGERQVVFVVGEPGIGKTAVVEAFLERAAASGDLWIGRGQCLEHYGAGEAYMPVLEAWGRLCREPGGEHLIELLRRHAPMWLMQMPSLIDEAELETLQRKVQGTTRERMLREMAETLEVLTAEKGLVLKLEDLHWSDYSTLGLVSYLAQRRGPARLLMIGTYRPADVVVSGHPLKGIKQELQVHGRCEEMRLELLKEKEVGKYLAVRFPGSHLPAKLTGLIHRRTDGNPLFMVNVVDYLVRQGMMVEDRGKWELKGGLEVVEVGVPESLRQMIEKQIEGLNVEEKRVLEVVSVAGVEFSVAAVAAGLKGEADEVEERCEELVRKEQFLRSGGIEEWPDGTMEGRYGFIHALYQNVLYDRVVEARRIRLHQRIGERKEAAYGNRAGEIAGELAVHFEEGRDYRRAVQYFGQAAENAIRRSAHQEAIGHLTKGLGLLKLDFIHCGSVQKPWGITC